ncbi:MAG: hypothetical protein IJ558_05330 [Treponema sp.]|nr:hypothetical protein [Treponema sp.]
MADYTLEIKLNAQMLGFGMYNQLHMMIDNLIQSTMNFLIDEFRIKGDKLEDDTPVLIVQIKVYEVPVNRQFLKDVENNIRQNFGNAVID